MADIKAMTHLPRRQQDFRPPHFANENAFIGDVVHSMDETAPICAGFYRLEKGKPLVYKYTYHEVKIILEGYFDITDETGTKVRATQGDVMYFPAGSTITFETETYGLGFFCGQRKPDAF